MPARSTPVLAGVCENRAATRDSKTISIARKATGGQRSHHKELSQGVDALDPNACFADPPQGSVCDEDPRHACRGPELQRLLLVVNPALSTYCFPGYTYCPTILLT